ncbi:MAG TPA: hypothetical protein VFX59_05970, partial [Polyangiales bacterium]|nr:hypothetical protein [Polyangiales bacterium]
MSLSKRSVSVVACSSLLLNSCGLGEILSPAGPRGLDSDGDGIVDTEDPNPTTADPNDKLNPKGGVGVGGKKSDLAFECNSDLRSAKTLQRLTRSEYVNTLRDLLTASTNGSIASAVLSAVDASLAAYPHDAVSKGAPFASMDQS